VRHCFGCPHRVEPSALFAILENIIVQVQRVSRRVMYCGMLRYDSDGGKPTRTRQAGGACYLIFSRTFGNIRRQPARRFIDNRLSLYGANQLVRDYSGPACIHGSATAVMHGEGTSCGDSVLFLYSQPERAGDETAIADYHSTLILHSSLCKNPTQF
jgi:hypothetical protein